MFCYICGCSLNEENCSSEHIIPNALGGRQKADILCKSCNNRLGNKYDSELVNNLRIFSNLLNPKRDNGVTPPTEYTMSGIKVYKPAGSNDSYGCEVKVKKIDNGLEFAYQAIGDKGKQELLRRHKRVLENFGRKWGWSEEKIKTKYNSFIAEVDSCEDKIDNPVMTTSFNIGGVDTYLSCLKTALNFYIVNGYDRSFVTTAIDILKNGSRDVLSITAPYYPDELFNPEIISNNLYLKGDSHNKKLFCIISFYNIFQVFVSLNNDYNGDDIEVRYDYDVANRKEYVFKESITLNDEEIRNILSREHMPTDKLQQHINTFLDCFIITPEHIKKTSSKIMKELESSINTFALESEFFTEKDILLKLLESLHVTDKCVWLINEDDRMNLLKGCISELYTIYLKQKAYYVFSQFVSEKFAKIFTRYYMQNGCDYNKLNMEYIKNLVRDEMKAFKFENTKLNLFLADTYVAINDSLDYVINNSLQKFSK